MSLIVSTSLRYILVLGLFPVGLSPCGLSSSCAFCLHPFERWPSIVNRLSHLQENYLASQPFTRTSPQNHWLVSVFNLSTCGGPLPRLCLGCLFPPSLTPLSNPFLFLSDTKVIPITLHCYYR